jgi:SAM-dependent methyltransferase
MPTLSPDQSPDPGPEQGPLGDTHQYREVAESFGSEAERYDRARPSYPSELVDRIVATSPGLDFLDVGIGTGIAARQFREAGCRGVGVEVDDRMAEVARRSGFEVEVSSIEAWDPAGRVFDGVVAAQAWHWVDPVAGALKAAEALRPGGRLAVFWNAATPPPDIARALAEVYRISAPEMPFNPWGSPGPGGYLAMCTKAADAMRQVGMFDEPEQWQFDWERPYTRAEWLDQLPTTGGHIQLAKATLDELLARVGEVVDSVGGSFMMGYAAVVATATRSVR